jgi:hypothetical protein
MNRANMARRTFLAGSSAVLAACRSVDGEYFGNTTPPTKQRLVFEDNAEPQSTASPAGRFLLTIVCSGADLLPV